MDYTITLIEAEDLALQYVDADPQEWIDNAAHNRARIAIDEICDLYVKHKLDNNQPITATNKPDMVLAAYEEGLVKTASQRNEEVASQDVIDSLEPQGSQEAQGSQGDTNTWQLPIILEIQIVAYQ